MSGRATSNLSTSLRQVAARHPDDVALVRGATCWTWSQLDARVDALAAALADAGIGPGSPVLLHAGNCTDYLTVMFATWRVGAVLTPTNARLTAVEVAPLAAFVRPALAVVDDACPEVADALAPVPVWRIGDAPSGPGARVDAIVAGRLGQHVPDAAVRVGEPAWYFFTSGSTGRPKAAVLTHDQLAFVVTNHLADLMPGLTVADAALVVAPLSHGAGVHALAHVARGARTVLLPGDSLDAAVAWDLVREHRVSTMFTVPTILNRLVRAVDGATDVSCLRYVVYAGAPISGPDQRRALEVLGPVLVQYYGLVEVTGAVTVLPPSAHDDVPTLDGFGTAGHARTGMTVSVRDDAGRPVPPGVRGEVCVAGPAVFPGYLANEEADARAFRDGWFRTGDLGMLDAAGWLYLTGRAGDVYISGGSNIDPREIEEKLLEHPLVRAAGVVGLPDPEWGEAGYAVVVVDGALTADGVVAWARTRMSGYKVPKRVHVVDQLPVSGYGKVTKALLREVLERDGVWAGPVRS